jgi:glycosyltransferase involved in cell wall biosynthesis
MSQAGSNPGEGEGLAGTERATATLSPVAEAERFARLTTMPPTLSIAMPAYNEAENLSSGQLALLDRYLSEALPNSEVIVVDDGSEDSTAEVVAEFCLDHPRFSLIRNPHHGKAQAVSTGVLAARGKYVLFMDMDMATSIEHIDEFVTALEDGQADIVIASREGRGAVRRNAPWARRFLGKGFNLLVQALILPGIQDTQCGFKAFKREVAQELFGSLVVFNDAEDVVGPRVTAFDVELLVAARRRGYAIRQQGVTWTHTRTRRVNMLREPWRMLRELLLVWANDRRHRYHRTPESETPAD